MVALGHLFAREGKLVECYTDIEIAQLVNLVACPRGPLESVLSVNALKRPGFRWDEAQGAAVSWLQAAAAGVRVSLVLDDSVVEPLDAWAHRVLAVQWLQWEGLKLNLEPPEVLSPCLFRSVPRVVRVALRGRSVSGLARCGQPRAALCCGRAQSCSKGRSGAAAGGGRRS